MVTSLLLAIFANRAAANHVCVNSWNNTEICPGQTNLSWNEFAWVILFILNANVLLTDFLGSSQSLIFQKIITALCNNNNSSVL